MTAMGTSLADKAWGRESAVYRISGVLFIIGGWFFTAFIAFTASFLIASLIYWGGQLAIIALILLAIFIVYTTHGIHKKREKEIKKTEENNFDFSAVAGKSAFEKSNLTIINSLNLVQKLYTDVTESFIYEKRKKISRTIKDILQFDKEVKSYKKNVHQTVQQLNEEESTETGDYYVQIIDYLRETAHCLTFLSKPIYDHLDNNHAPLEGDEKDDLKLFLKKFNAFTQRAIKMIESKDFSSIDKLNANMQELLALLNNMRKDHLKNVKDKAMSTRLSMLYIDTLFETKNLVLYIVNLTKTTRDFADYNKLGNL
jgi:Na+/phosphate symporter